MPYREITDADKNAFNAVVSHPLQSFEWGAFREKTGVKVIRRGIFDNDKLVSGFQLTIHKIPHSPFTIGYLPKSDLPTKDVAEELKKIGKEENCLFIQIEPNVIGNKNNEGKIKDLGLISAAHPLFTKYTFSLDLTKSEEEILKNMHSKSRYNIKVAQKRGVEVFSTNKDKDFQEFLKLNEETTKRQKFYSHSNKYFHIMRDTLYMSATDPLPLPNELIAHLFTAELHGETLTSWILFTFHDTLYYPYGASSSKHREAMASNLIMWEAIKFGKKLGLKKFDMWGALGPDPDPKDPWIGFHNFKQKYGPEHVEFVGSFDLVINPVLYQAFKVADKLRWFLLKLKS